MGDLQRRIGYDWVTMWWQVTIEHAQRAMRLLTRDSATKRAGSCEYWFGQSCQRPFVHVVGGIDGGQVERSGEFGSLAGNEAHRLGRCVVQQGWVSSSVRWKQVLADGDLRRVKSGLQYSTAGSPKMESGNDHGNPHLSTNQKLLRLCRTRLQVA